nr:hypothetical protein [Tanacetum cinerariifolium]
MVVVDWSFLMEDHPRNSSKVAVQVLQNLSLFIIFMASSANSSTQNPPRKIPRTNFIDLSSNESSPIQNNLINTTLNTTLSLTIPLPTISQTILSHRTNVSPLAPKTLVFSTHPSSPLEPQPYLSSLDDLPSRNSNPPPPSLSQGHSQGLSQTLPQQTPMDFKPSFTPINLFRSRMSAQPEPFLSRDQVMQELGQYQDFDRHLEVSI